MSRRRDDDAGVLSAALVLLTAALLVCAGLALDGGRVLAARRQAASLAMAAARAGVQDPDLRSGPAPVLVPARAEAAARALLAGTPAEAVTVATDGDRVTVTVALHRRHTILGLVGVGETTVRATRTARLVPSSEVDP